MEGVGEMGTVYNVVDSDAHVIPPPDFWAEYLPERYRAQAPRIERRDDADYVVFEGKSKKYNALTAAGGKRPEDFRKEGRVDDARVGGWMPYARLEDMDADGVDAAVLYGGGPLGTADPELFLASFEAYNRWLADFCKAAPDRLAGIAYLPMHDVDFAIDLMRRMAKLGMRGVNIPAFPQSRESLSNTPASGVQMLALTGDPNGERQYRDPEFYPFWEAAIELGMSVSIHLGARSARFNESEHFLPDMLMTKFAMAEPMAIMIFGGVFERYPDLKFALVESGVGWMPFAAQYMDSVWGRHRHWTKNTLPHPPSYYMDRNVYGSFIFDRVGVLQHDLPGGRNIMWSTDYPHSESSYPHSMKNLEETFRGIPEEHTKLITCERAKKLYHFG